MAINAQQTVIGIFDERGMADRAVDDLQNAGFSPDQIFYSGPGENPNTGFWQGIKNLFTPGRDTSDDDVAKALRNMGLSDDEIRYYKGEYDSGRAIIAVRAPGREQDALAIMRADGAHN